MMVILLVFGSGFNLLDVKPIQAAEKALSPVSVDLGTPIQAAQTIDASFGMEDGANIVYTTVSGSASAEDWAIFNVIDIDNEKLLSAHELKGATSAWAHHTASDGKVYIGASDRMFVYSPEENQVTELGVPIQGTESIWSLTEDDAGNIYGGIYSSKIGGRVFKVDAETQEVSDFLGEAVDANEDYIRSLAYADGHVYAGTGTKNGRVFKIDVNTKEKERIELPGSPDDEVYQGKYNAMGLAYGMTVVGDNLFVFFNGPSTLHVFDIKKEEWRETIFENIRGLMAVTGEHDGKVYTSKKDGNMWEIDVETLDEKIAMPFDGSIRASKWLDVKNKTDFTGPMMVTISYNGEVVLSDPRKGQKQTMRSLVQGQGLGIQAMEKGPDGKIYVSGYMGNIGAIYDPENGDAMSHFSIGQAEGFGSVGDTMFAGVYTSARIYGWDTSGESIEDKQPPFLYQVGEEQDRPFVLTEGDGKLLVGTIPDYAKLGGAISVYDPQASKAAGKAVYDTYRNVIPKHAIGGLAYKDGIVYGSTTIHGGLGIEPEASKAKLFAWDLESRSLIKEWDLELEGLSDTVPLISGLTVGEDGLIWGTANGFVFAFDSKTHEVVKQANVYPKVTNFGRWRPMKQVFGNDGLLYTNVADTLTVINPETMESKKLFEQVSVFDLNNQDDIYYPRANRIFKQFAEKPSNVVVTMEKEVYVDELTSFQVEADFYGWTKDITSKVEIKANVADGIEVKNHDLMPKQAGEMNLDIVYLGDTIASVDLHVKERGNDTGHIVEIEEFDRITVEYGTKEEQLHLPNTIMITLSDSEKVRVPVLWQVKEAGYDGNQAGVYKIVGQIETGLLNPKELKPSIEVEVREASGKTIVRIPIVEDIYVKPGTKQEDIPFPETLDVTLSNGEKETISIEWEVDQADYDSEVEGSYSFEGKLITELENPDELKARIRVVVEDENKIDPSLPVPIYQDIINPDFEAEEVDGEIPGWSIKDQADHTSVTRTDEQTYSGNHSIHLKDATTSGYVALQSELIEVEAGKEYTTGAHVYLGDVLTNPETNKPFSSNRTMYQVRYYDAEGNELNDYMGLGVAFEGPQHEWVNKEFSFTPHEQVKYVRILLSSSNAWVSNAFYDDVYLYTKELPSIEEVAALDSITVDYGTEFDDLPLPKIVEVTLNNRETIYVPVLWESAGDGYHAELAGTYHFQGSLQTDIAIADSLTVSISVIVEEEVEEPMESLSITDVASLEAIEVAYGTKKESIDLVESIEVTMNDGSKRYLPVIWGEGEPIYNGKKPGIYIFKGMLQLPNSRMVIENPEALYAQVQVTVLEKEISDEKEDGSDEEGGSEGSGGQGGSGDPGDSSGTGEEDNTEETGDVGNLVLPSDENDDMDLNVDLDDQNRDSGNELPKTATNQYNLLLVGSFLLLLASVTLYYYRKKHQQTSE